MTDFNSLSSREKWNTYKKIMDKFICPKCKTESIPSTCSPFPGAEKCCGECDFMLTRRTGGGQLDPFNWLFTSE